MTGPDDNAIRDENKTIEAAVRDILSSPRKTAKAMAELLKIAGAGQPAHPRDGISPQLREEVDRFKSRLDSLLLNPDYRDKYVAMRKGEVVDCDADEFKLAARIDKKYPHEVVLIKKVTSEPEPVYEVPSPELR